jgi:hypothetical protein
MEKNATTFYAHHIITQGHTNRGQWLGAGIGTGANGQYIGFKTFYKKGFFNIFIQRENSDNDYIWFIGRSKGAEFSAILSFGVENLYKFTDFLSLFTKIVYSEIFNPLYNITGDTRRDGNFHLSAALKFVL